MDEADHQQYRSAPVEPDPALQEHIMAIRDRFGVRGLKAAHRLLEEQIRRYDGVYQELARNEGHDDSSKVDDGA